MSQAIEKLIEEMTAIIIKGVDPKQVILFGSQAKRTARPMVDRSWSGVSSDPQLGPALGSS
jgi:hypothetical protein